MSAESNLFNYQSKVYAPPSRLDADEPQADLRASFGGSQRDKDYNYFVNGVQVFRTFATRSGRGGNYVLCQFPDGSARYVNEKNLIERKKHQQRRLGVQS